MEALEQTLTEATSSKKIPAVLLAATNRDGTLNYFKPFGNTSLSDESPPASAQSTLTLASATKLITCVAAMQVIEQNLISLDEDLTTLLPEWSAPQKLTWEDEKPNLVQTKTPITMRMLLSHTSGITGLESLSKYYKYLGDPRGTLLERYFGSDDEETIAQALVEIKDILGRLLVDPLSFEPGTSWAYGQGVDWAGQVVERLTNMSLEDYCQQNIFIPLRMTNTTYHPLAHPSVLQNLLPMSRRSPSTSLAINCPSIYPLSPPTDMGGAGLFTTTPDFLALLSSLISPTAPQILKPETIDLMFSARLPNTEGFAEFKKAEGEGWSEGVTADHCLAGYVNVGDVEGRKRDGSVNWGGATNVHWWIDRKAGVAGFFGMTMLGMGDGGICDGYFKAFEKAVYKDFVLKESDF